MKKAGKYLYLKTNQIETTESVPKIIPSKVAKGKSIVGSNEDRSESSSRFEALEKLNEIGNHKAQTM